MAKLAIKKASTDVTTYVFIQDSSKTTGEGLTGLAYNTASLVGYYVRPKGSATAITLATQTVTGDHSDGGFVEIDATNMPGVYRLDLPDAVCATGVPSVVVMLKGATNMSPVVLEIQLTDFDLNTAAITAAGIADAVWDEAISGHTTATTFGGKNQKVVPSETINDYKADVSALTNVTLTAAYDKAKDDVLTPLAVVDSIVDGLKTTLDNIHDTDLPAVKNDTASIASAINTIDGNTEVLYDDLVNGGRLDLLIDSIITHLTDIKGAGWTDESLTALMAAIEAISAGSGATAQEVWEYATRVLTAGTNIDLSSLATADNLATLDGKVDIVDGILDDLHDTDIPAIKAETALIVADTGTDGVKVADGALGFNEFSIDYWNTFGMMLPDPSIVTAIKAKTDNLPATPASAGEYTAAIAALQADLDNPDQYKANITTLATTTDMTDLKDRIDAVDAIADAILEDTGTTIPATLATIAGYTDGIAGDVWSYAKRTLTHPSVSAEEPEDSNTLILYRDADIAIELTDLTIPVGAKKYIFTIKDNLDSGDDQAVLQASYAIDGSEVETNTLVYINSAAAPVLTNPVTFTLTETNITIDLTAEAAALLPRYERGYLNWDLKLVTDAAVTIVLQGLAQIIGTSTRAIE